MLPLMMLPVALAAAPMQAAPAPVAPASALAPFDGVWRGPATLTGRDGVKRALIHTERFGPALGGAIRVVEGKAYNPDGSDANFNAFGVMSATDGGAWEFRTYAQGHGGTFPLTVTPGGFSWGMPAGPGAVVRYTAKVSGGTWHEEGWYERDGKPLAKVFEMNLTRVGDTDWPAGHPVTAR
jgi:hypothetical protein